MKKVIKFILMFIVICAVIVAGNLIIKGVPITGIPDAEEVSKVIVEHGDYPEETKEFTDERNIELATLLPGYLNRAPLKGLSDDNRLITITYVLKDGTEQKISANEYSVWWGEKACALRDEKTFVKMCTAVFFLQES